ncbi:MAG: hypothetical protein SXQ77_01325 [Halobacteria archaeon]|nr:hypothetical protein [Halobacteria archaeon]
MRGVKFRALLRFDKDGLFEVGEMTTTKPENVVGQIERRRDNGEIDIAEESELWIIPAGSFMKRTAVPTKADSTVENDRQISYKTDDDRDYGDTYLALTPTAQGEFRIDGYVRAVKPEMAARVAASLKGGRMDAKNVLMVPDQTVNRFTVESSNS